MNLIKDTMSEHIAARYFPKRVLPHWYVLVVDCFTVLFAGVLAYLLDWNITRIVENFSQLFLGLVMCLPFYIFSFRLFHTYQGIIRYSSNVDLYRVAKATLLSSLLVWGFTWFMKAYFLSDDLYILPSEELIIVIFGLSTFFLWLLRLLVKSWYDSIHSVGSIPVAVYGAKNGGVALANSLRGGMDRGYSLKAFISDGDEFKGGYLLGKPVYKNGKGIAATLRSQGVRVLLVSPLKTQRFRNSQSMIDEITEAGIRIMMMPDAEVWDGKSEIRSTQLHEVEIEDLLPRDCIEVDMTTIQRMLSGKRILITGAAGSIGSELARQVSTFGPSALILVDQAETPMHDMRLWMKSHATNLRDVHTIVGSITNKTQMEDIFSRLRPEYVFHAAAYKHVPMMEDNPAMAVQNNIYGTRVIADLAVKYGTKKFVMVSTDKAVNPTNVMGCSKRICEIYCQSLNNKLWQETSKTGRPSTQFITTRFGNVLGSNGSVIPIFRDQIRQGGPVMVTHPDIIRYFMLISEACRLVLEAGTMGNGGEIFVFDMGKPVKIVDLARRMIMLSGAPDIEIRFSGLRDGEKLYEEVLNDAEHTKPTKHPKIKVASVREYSYELACRNEDELYELSKSYDDMAIVRKMKEIVPEYKSSISKYEVIDQELEQSSGRRAAQK